MRQILMFLIVFTFTIFSFGQDEETIYLGYGNGYSKQIFYNLSDNEEKSFENFDWDLAFTIDEGVFGVHVNEASTFMQESNHIYRVWTIDFTDELNTDYLLDQDELFNGEESWNVGALNVHRDSMDTNDYGWGIYEPSSGEIEEARINAIQLRSGAWKKIKISFANGTYHVTWANLDNSDEQTMDIKKSDYAGGTLALLSIENNKMLNKLDPWDLYIGRYSAGIDVQGELVPYTVLGVLSNGKIQMAEFEVEDQSITITDVADFEGHWERNIDVIGHTWKEFDLNAGGWVIFDDVVFYAKTSDAIYKLVFNTFGGSSTPEMDFTKTKLDIAVGNYDLDNNKLSLDIFPNPIQNGNVIFGFELDKTNDINITVMNSLGQKVWNGTKTGTTGFNVKSIDLGHVENGFYSMILESNNEYSVRKFIIAE